MLIKTVGIAVVYGQEERGCQVRHHVGQMTDAQAAAAASEPAFAKIWNNPEDDIYDHA
jgi:hypothetical protein